MSSTIDPDGKIISTTVEDRKAFVTFERSICPKPYETAKASCMVQVDLPQPNGIETLNADTDAIATAYGTAKQAVYQQLGVKYEVTDELLIVEVENLEKQLAATVVEGEKPTTPTARKPAAKKRPGKDDQEAWANLEANPDGWFDNRRDKRNPKAPDFKAKRTNKAFADHALWLDSAPEGFVEPPM